MVVSHATDVLTLTVTRADRLDKAVASLAAGLSRSAVQRLVEQGRVLVNGVAQDADFRVQPGHIITVRLPEPPPGVLHEVQHTEPLSLDILYEDAGVIVVNKPAGMVVHPAPGNASGTLVHAVLSYAPEVITVGDAHRPGIVHRLDKETSGLLLIAKSEAARSALQSQFKARTIKKTYLALCVGRVQPERGLIHKPIARDPSNRRRMAVVVNGKEATTQYAVLEVFTHREGEGGTAYSLVRVHPLTGRTHQIRVHLASIGYPLVGDALYGMRRDPLTRRVTPRHLLHASELTFVSPATGELLSVHAPLPEDMRSVIDALGAE